MSWGAVFDWDGVIVDSSAFHEESWSRLAEREGRSLPAGHFKRGFGMRNEHIIPHILEWASAPDEIAALADRKEKLYREILMEKGMEPLPGVLPWLQALQAEGIPCAIGSSTPRANIDCALEITGLTEYFAAITSGGDVKKGKPAPDIFLLAATRIGMPPSRCIVFEDAHVGIDAARAAGMKVVAVTTTHAAEALSNADIVVRQLDELDVISLPGDLWGG